MMVSLMPNAVVVKISAKFHYDQHKMFSHDLKELASEASVSRIVLTERVSK